MRVGFLGDRRAQVAAGDPESLGYASSHAREERRDAIGVARLVKPDAAHPRRRVAEMCVGIDEARQEHAIAELDDLCGGTLEREDLALVADGDDAVAPGGDGLGLGTRRVERPDAAAAEDDVR